MTGIFSAPPLALASSAIQSNIAIGLDAVVYSGSPLSPSEDNADFGISLKPEFETATFEGKLLLNFTPYIRINSGHGGRDHADLRELSALYYQDYWEALVGYSKVFWGVAESSHLVDIINQTDYLDDIDGEDKLGQPMLRISRAYDQSVLTIFVLPGFREREFLDVEDPLSLPFVMINESDYQSSDEDDHVDYAIRFSGYAGVLDYGVSWFSGTSRDPMLLADAGGTISPFYPLIDQYGLDIQATMDAWLWKSEMIYRSYDSETSEMSEDYFAMVGGFEYTMYSLQDGLYDLGLLLEYHYDDRSNPIAVVFQNDVFSAMRFGFNDTASSEVLAGIFVDLDDQTSSFRLEGNRRVFTDARMSLEVQSFFNVYDDNVSAHLAQSDYVKLSLEWFF